MNPTCMDDYVYLPFKYPSRDLQAISQYRDKQRRSLSFDVVRLVIDLAYLPEEKAKSLKFN